MSDPDRPVSEHQVRSDIMRKILTIAVAAVVLTAVVYAQRGHGNPGSNQGGQQAGRSSTGTYGTPGWQGTQTQTRQQQQTHVQATTQQRLQFQDCTQATKQLQKRVRKLEQISRKQGLTAQEAAQWREQLRQQTRTMTEQQEQFINQLNESQQAAVQDRTRQIQQDRERLSLLSDALEFELAAETPNAERVRENAKQMSSVLNQVQVQQNEVGSELGLKD
jgi:hypothetical protein